MGEDVTFAEGFVSDTCFWISDSYSMHRMVNSLLRNTIPKTVVDSSAHGEFKI